METIELGRDKAIEVHESEWWVDKPAIEIALRQLQTDELICPFSIFHEAVEAVVGHSVSTHEFGGGGRERLWREIIQRGANI